MSTEDEDLDLDLEHRQATDLAHSIGDILQGHTGNVVQRTLGILLVTAAAQDVIDIPDLCMKASEILPRYVQGLKKAEVAH